MRRFKEHIEVETTIDRLASDLEARVILREAFQLLERASKGRYFKAILRETAAAKEKKQKQKAAKKPTAKAQPRSHRRYLRPPEEELLSRYTSPKEGGVYPYREPGEGMHPAAAMRRMFGPAGYGRAVQRWAQSMGLGADATKKIRSGELKIDSDQFDTEEFADMLRRDMMQTTSTEMDDLQTQLSKLQKKKDKASRSRAEEITQQLAAMTKQQQSGSILPGPEWKKVVVTDVMGQIRTKLDAGKSPEELFPVERRILDMWRTVSQEAGQVVGRTPEEDVRAAQERPDDGPKPDPGAMFAGVPWHDVVWAMQKDPAGGRRAMQVRKEYEDWAWDRKRELESRGAGREDIARHFESDPEVTRRRSEMEKAFVGALQKPLGQVRGLVSPTATGPRPPEMEEAVRPADITRDYDPKELMGGRYQSEIDERLRRLRRQQAQETPATPTSPAPAPPEAPAAGKEHTGKLLNVSDAYEAMMQRFGDQMLPQEELDRLFVQGVKRDILSGQGFLDNPELATSSGMRRYEAGAETQAGIHVPTTGLIKNVATSPGMVQRMTGLHRPFVDKKPGTKRYQHMGDIEAMPDTGEEDDRPFVVVGKKERVTGPSKEVNAKYDANPEYFEKQVGNLIKAAIRKHYKGVQTDSDEWWEAYQHAMMRVLDVTAIPEWEENEAIRRSWINRFVQDYVDRRSREKSRERTGMTVGQDDEEQAVVGAQAEKGFAGGKAARTKATKAEREKEQEQLSADKVSDEEVDQATAKMSATDAEDFRDIVRLFYKYIDAGVPPHKIPDEDRERIGWLTDYADQYPAAKDLIVKMVGGGPEEGL